MYSLGKICTVPDLIIELFINAGIFLLSPNIMASNMPAGTKETYLKINSSILLFNHSANPLGDNNLFLFKLATRLAVLAFIIAQIP